MADALYELPRLAEIYDLLEAERPDLDAYVALADERNTHVVLDVGCGTGTLACRFAQQDKEVTAVDPAEASIEVARRKPYADLVRWVLGDVTGLAPLQVDLAVLTGNVAQVFLTDEQWMETLLGVRAVLKEEGSLGAEASLHRGHDRRARVGWRAPAVRTSTRPTPTSFGAPAEPKLCVGRSEHPLQPAWLTPVGPACS